jgi:putative heme iron utilization protein
MHLNLTVYVNLKLGHISFENCTTTNIVTYAVKKYQMKLLFVKSVGKNKIKIYKKLF